MKINKIEVSDEGYFSTELTVYSENGEVDKLELSNSYDKLSVLLLDRDIKSYRLIGETVTNKVEKLTGALAGGVFNLEYLGVKIPYLYDCDENNCSFYIDGESGSYTIKLDDFLILVSINKDMLFKPTFKIVKEV